MAAAAVKSEGAGSTTSVVTVCVRLQQLFSRLWFVYPLSAREASSFNEVDRQTCSRTPEKSKKSTVSWNQRWQSKSRSDLALSKKWRLIPRSSLHRTRKCRIQLSPGSFPSHQQSGGGIAHLDHKNDTYFLSSFFFSVDSRKRWDWKSAKKRKKEESG